MIVTIVSKLVYFTYLRDLPGYNPFTKYHGHPSTLPETNSKSTPEHKSFGPKKENSFPTIRNPLVLEAMLVLLGCPRKLGSKVGIRGLFHPKEYPIFK